LHWYQASKRANLGLAGEGWGTDVMSDLRDWLRRNNLEQYADAFEANDIDLDVLPELGEASAGDAQLLQNILRAKDNLLIHFADLRRRHAGQPEFYQGTAVRN
jgi:hypothetical protein